MDWINKNPVTKTVQYNIGLEPKKVRALTVEEQQAFLKVAKDTSTINQYVPDSSNRTSYREL